MRSSVQVEEIGPCSQQVTAGVPGGEGRRQVETSEQPFYRWKKEYGMLSIVQDTTG